MAEKILEMESISKNFGPVNVLKGINFELIPGEVHALLGENGAGKSTLIKILGGIHQPNEGKIFIDNKIVDIKGVQDAEENGIGIIHQEIILVPHLSVAENIFLGKEPRTKLGLKDIKKINKLSQDMVSRLGLNIEVNTLVKNLTIAQKQLVEIVKAVSFDVKILVMDEPTSSLSDEEVNHLFDMIERLKQNNIGVIYISHRFEELFKITNRITVIRDGYYIGTKRTLETSSDELVSMMVGREVNNMYTKTISYRNQEVFKANNLSKKGFFNNINFTVNKGEILGFSGLMGAGRSELMQAIFGAYQYEEGHMYLNGENIVIKNCSDAIKKGIGMVTEDRKGEGLILNHSVGFNTTLAEIKNLMRNKIIISERKRKDLIEKYIRKLNIKTHSAHTEISKLSGGNQQKVVIAKWLATNPQLLILDEPTRGVDVGAKSEIYSLINELALDGLAIILVSSDLPEIINMCDSVCVMQKGEIKAELSGNEIFQENIMYYATEGEAR